MNTIPKPLALATTCLAGMSGGCARMKSVLVWSFLPVGLLGAGAFFVGI
ncbi:MAG: hypothetical protein HY744_01455 [Deltaproteobacteria bacterium]|nr:hypothetical protein [Deltaproteobacteria bacterium]